MKTITITITTPAGATVYQARAHGWSDLVLLERLEGARLAGIVEDLQEQLRWHSFRCRIFAEENGYVHEEREEGDYKGGESR